MSCDRCWSDLIFAREILSISPLLSFPSHLHTHTLTHTHIYTRTLSHIHTFSFTHTHIAFVPAFFFYFALLSIWRFAQVAISPQSLSVFKCVYVRSLSAIVVSVGGWGTTQKEREILLMKSKKMLYICWTKNVNFSQQSFCMLIF